MHFGQTNTLVKLPKLILLICALTGITFVISCKSGGSHNELLSFKMPEQGQGYGLGEDVKVQLNVPADDKISSVNYLLDGKVVGSKHNGEALTIKTDGLSLG